MRTLRLGKIKKQCLPVSKLFHSSSALSDGRVLLFATCHSPCYKSIVHEDSLYMVVYIKEDFIKVKQPFGENILKEREALVAQQ